MKWQKPEFVLPPDQVFEAANAALRGEITSDEWEKVIKGEVTLESVRKPPAKPIEF